MIPFEYLQIFIYLMFFFGLISYATLDGFDLGVGTLHLFAKGDLQRRIMLNAIGPVWDGNTTWIVITSGILFAGFPRVFANLSSNLYIPTMLLLFGFMLRGASVEFRSKGARPSWRRLWDIAFSFSSYLLAIMVGLILGNLIEGLPLTPNGEYLGGFAALLKPYPLLIAAFGLITFGMHGTNYLLMKTEGEFQDKIRSMATYLTILFLILWITATTVTFNLHPHMVAPFFKYPILWIFPLLSLTCIGGTVLSLVKRREGWGFFYSCFSIVFLLVLVVIGQFPNLVISTIAPEVRSLTLFNSSSSRIALIVMSIVTILGIPLSYFYGTYIYKVFRGKVKIDDMSY